MNGTTYGDVLESARQLPLDDQVELVDKLLHDLGSIAVEKIC